MSSRSKAAGSVLPPNPTWVEFPRSDGVESTWPLNTTRVVDHEGHVNYMQSTDLSEKVAVNWRNAVGAKVASGMGLPDGPAYVLKEWPAGYRMFVHYKGPQANPRTDVYLFGSQHIQRFRSINEFIPHAVWLCTDPTMNRANCECKYCSKRTQRTVTEDLGLAPKPSSVRGSPTASRRPARLREPRTRDDKPYAAVRRQPRSARLPTKPPLKGPEQFLVPERNNDILAASAKFKQNARWYRKGELVWCSLEPPIETPSGDRITFWPGVVEDVALKTEPVASSSDSLQNSDVDMTGLYEEEESTQEPGPSRFPGNPVDAPPPIVSGTDDRIPWTVRQWNLYTVKLLAVRFTCQASDEQILPYLAYEPTEELVYDLQRSLDDLVAWKATEEPETILKQDVSFNPYVTEDDGASTSDETSRYHRAIAPYTFALQIASTLASYWSLTDEWECRLTIPAAKEPPPATSGVRPTPSPSLHALITQSMANNAQSDLQARNKAQVDPDGGVYGPPGLSTEELTTLHGRVLGNGMLPGPIAHTVVQPRFQGLWWGAERIWTDELVRIKLARCQFAPNGGEVIHPPAGPTAGSLRHDEPGLPVDLRQGTGDRGLFMRLEGLFVVDVKKPDGSATKECRASGMLYELVDEDWEEGADKVEAESISAVSKGKEAEVSSQPVAAAGNNPAPESISSFGAANPAPIAQDASGPSFMPGPSPLKPPPLPNPDPTVPVEKVAEATLAETLPSQTPKKRTLNGQLSHPVLSTPYSLPEPPTGYKFRPILAPGHEVVLSLSLISGRYYPGLFKHPLLAERVNAALIMPDEHGGLLANKSLWAMQGLLPGMHQSMDPIFWRPARVNMLRDADAEALRNFVASWQQRKIKHEPSTAEAQNVQMLVQGEAPAPHAGEPMVQDTEIL
ncbi:hypothetical protein CERSUDRAFT_104223 [Gelatoporia subvermispora B]|uniref:Cryptic loci regulator 2 N-terminal domain-containing protein n=1 Tax=Ceriporiopsis subvermispora (strain B) TaxID=914234 RepID=M2PQV0_CERS8|nr:hypothetical protein CERSUDRAFT_104223 [Gelatoporia subvermispora B]